MPRKIEYNKKALKEMAMAEKYASKCDFHYSQAKKYMVMGNTPQESKEISKKMEKKSKKKGK